MSDHKQATTDSASAPGGVHGLPGDRSRQIPPQAIEQRRKAHAHRAVLQALGSIVSVLIHSPPHRGLTIAGLEAGVVPAVATGQFAIAEATIKETGLTRPIAFVLWGSFSPEIDTALQARSDQPFPVKPADWRSGDIVWITDAAGNGRQVSALIERQKQTVWKGRTVRLRVTSQDGTAKVDTLVTAAPVGSVAV